MKTVEMASKFGARVLLRIDDMDRERVSREYVEDIFETLAFLDISWDEGPRSVGEFEREWSQMHRIDLYRSALSQLRDSVFACSCSRADVLRVRADGVYPGTCRDRGIPLDANGVSWRLRTEEEDVPVRILGEGLGPASSNVGKGWSERWGEEGGMALRESDVLGARFAGKDAASWKWKVMNVQLPEEMKDFVVRKKDGYPAYQLSSVVDDLHFGVDLVVRGNDLWPSTIAQHVVAGRLGKGAAFGAISFYHHSLLMGEGGKKLSKSAGDTSVRHLRKKGWKKEDVLEAVAKMMG